MLGIALDIESNIVNFKSPSACRKGRRAAEYISTRTVQMTHTREILAVLGICCEE